MSLLQLIAILATTLFAGASIYINVAEHPARMECGTAIAATVFGPSYRRAAVMQVALALIGTAAAVGTWMAGASRAWLIGALLIFSVIPFTLLIIMPTNKKLLDARLDRTSVATHDLLRRWGRLHAVRSILSLVSSFVFLWSLT